MVREIFIMFLVVASAIGLSVGAVKWIDYDTKPITVNEMTCVSYPDNPEYETRCDSRKVFIPTVKDGTFSFLFDGDRQFLYNEVEDE